MRSTKDISSFEKFRFCRYVKCMTLSSCRYDNNNDVNQNNVFGKFS